MKTLWKTALILVLTAAIAALPTACGTKPPEETQEGDSAEIEMFTRFADGESKAFFDDVAARYMEEHPGVKIVVSSADNENYKKEINVRLGSNAAPDIYFAWSGIYAENFVNGGRALDLTAYVEDEAAWPGKILKNQFGPFTYGGNIYGVPIIMDGKTFYYNKDIFDELNLSVPENWTDFLAVLEAVAKTDYIPISLGNIDDWATGHYMTTLNQRVVPADTLAADYALEGNFGDPAYVEALEYLMQLTPYFTPDFNAVSYDEGISDFITGNAAMYYEQFNQVQYIAPAEFAWSWFDFPDIEGAAGDQNALTGAPQGFMVSSATKYPDVCVDFLRYLTSPDIAAQMVKDTMMISAVEGAINDDTAAPYLAEIAETIKRASSINLWLDNAMNSEVVAVYLSGIQAMVGGSLTPQQVMEDVQDKAKEIAAEQ
ncbi:MAG: extracellular solute-binding protein [Clostridiales Family XIII bacterium]|nr:extracellular solute-binding protein [Clostridiales Family XIII bacterium]